jgi:hypothetical protein
LSGAPLAAAGFDVLGLLVVAFTAGVFVAGFVEVAAATGRATSAAREREASHVERRVMGDPREGSAPCG